MHDEAEALERLPFDEDDQVWGRFEAAFEFRPDIAEFPAITEPDPSVTWSLAVFDDDDRTRRDRGLDRLVGLVEHALTAGTPPGGSVLVMDWCHPTYRLRPHLPPTELFRPYSWTDRLSRWPRSPYPNGDYFVLIAEDFSRGSFGHPQERSLCLFGADLLGMIADDVEAVLGEPIRRNGRWVSATAPEPL